MTSEGVPPGPAKLGDGAPPSERAGQARRLLSSPCPFLALPRDSCDSALHLLSTDHRHVSAHVTAAARCATASAGGGNT